MHQRRESGTEGSGIDPSSAESGSWWTKITSTPLAASLRVTSRE
jgi:hypothetical protein